MIVLISLFEEDLCNNVLLIFFSVNSLGNDSGNEKSANFIKDLNIYIFKDM